MYAAREIIKDSDILLVSELDIIESPIVNEMQSREHTPSVIDH